MAALATPARALLFTDPSVLGITKSGDVDDIAALLLLAQAYGEGLTVVICDDADGLRYQNFMDKYGSAIAATYGCKIIQEAAVVGEGIPPNTTVFVHAPTTAVTAAWMDSQKATITKVFAQGEASDRANFKNAPAMWALLNSADLIGITTFFLSNDTKFVIDSGVTFATSLHPIAQSVLDDYYLFKRFAAFGIPASITPAADALYSDSGGPPDFPGGPKTVGNGIKSKLPFINKLRDDGKMPAQNSEELIQQLGLLEPALQKTYIGENESTKTNIRDALWLLKNYCDYESYLTPEGKLPNMSHFKSIPPRRASCDPDVQLALEPNESTPLFDAASAAFGLNLVGIPRGPTDKSHHPILRKIIRDSLKAFSDKLMGVPEEKLWKPTPRTAFTPSYPTNVQWPIVSPTFPPTQPGDWGVNTSPEGSAMVNGGRKTRRRRRKRRKTRR